MNDLQINQTPHSIDSEQALIGSLIMNNGLLESVDEFLKAEHFYVGVHGKIFETIKNLIEKGQIADPVSLTSFFKSADWFTDLGGKDFLQHLNDNASKIINAKTYADIIYKNFLERQLIKVGSDIVNTTVSNYQSEDKQEPMELISKAEETLFKLAQTGDTGKDFQDLKNPLLEVIRKVELAKASGSDITGRTTGFTDFDKLTGGLQDSDLIILAARPSMGKTTFALNIALNAARATLQGKSSGAGVGIFSLEMSADQIAAKFLASTVEINQTKLAKGQIGQDEHDKLISATDQLTHTPIYIDDTPALNINALRARARRLKRKHDIGMIVVDYLQLIQASAENKVQEISKISQSLKTIARELDVPVIALSQLNRSVDSRENKRPLLSDLRESGSIEQDADIVMFLFREEYYIEKEMGADPESEAYKRGKAKIDENNLRGKAELLISKNRKGATSAINLSFNGSISSFKNFVK
ncbi:MAG: replicative DNA helicase [Proteobacteria bacterium]|nr:replicative DNA helicase [Pseudomonadota bacterium]